MSRKRSGSYRRPRQTPASERSYYEYLASAPAPSITRPELIRLVKGGEDTYLELKVRFSNVEKLTAEIIALANTEGGAIVFGVNDQLRVEGVEDPEAIESDLRDLCANQIEPPVFPYINKVAFDNGRRIVLLEIDPHLRPHRTLDDRFYVREGSSKREATREELSAIYNEAFRTRFEQVPILDSSVEDDIDESLFWSFVREANPGFWGGDRNGFPTEFLMRDLGLAIEIGNGFAPLFGGLLLFGTDTRLQELIPRARLVLSRYSGADSKSPLIERTEVTGNLLRLYDGAMSFVSRYVDLWDSRPPRRVLADTRDEQAAVESLQVAARANYHRGACIEALVNLLAHCDWGPRERGPRIDVFDSSIEFINPVLRTGLPMTAMRYGISSPPNPLIKGVVANGHYGIPPTSGGVPMIHAASLQFSRRAAEGPSFLGGEVRLKLMGIH
jgi:ATP-dependent DNA helicase RecG